MQKDKLSGDWFDPYTAPNGARFYHFITDDPPRVHWFESRDDAHDAHTYAQEHHANPSRILYREKVSKPYENTFRVLEKL